MTNREYFKKDITPQTFVGDLLNNFPELEDKLIEIAPVFKKLKNPVLRKTISKVTTLKQAAVIGNIPVAKLINELRKEAGLEGIEVKDEQSNQVTVKPEWVLEKNIIKRYDARQDLENGIHPAAKVTKDILELKGSDVYVLTTAFIPVPLLKIMEEKGFATFTEKVDDGCFNTYVKRQNK